MREPGLHGVGWAKVVESALIVQNSSKLLRLKIKTGSQKLPPWQNCVVLS